MKTPPQLAASPLRRQAADTLLRARKLPPGPYRNDPRQLAYGLLRLHRIGLQADVRVVDRTTGFDKNPASKLPADIRS
jgi:hypothetical protein